MRKAHLSLLLFLYLFACRGNAQTLVSADYIGQKSSSQLQTEFNLILIQYNVKYYRIAYTTHDVHGVPDTATGLLCVPDVAGKRFPRLVYQHGTSGSKLDVPSLNIQSNGEGVIGRLFGGLGFISILPDYLGLGGISRGFHPYVHAESEASAALDMLKACESFLDQNGIQYNDQLFITGYSQGGHGAMALARAIDTDPDSEYNVTAAAPMSGPYSLSKVMRELILSDDVYYYPGYIPNTALSFQTVYGNLFSKVSEVFKSPYDVSIQQFYDGQMTLSSLNQLLVNQLIANEGASRPFRMLRSDYVQEVMDNPQHPLNLALRANDTYDNWKPEFPLRLFYCTADDQVPYLNSLLARDSLLAAGATDFSISDVNSSANHGECVRPALTATIIFFLGYQQIETSGTQNLAAWPELQISPVPASDQLLLEHAPAGAEFGLFDSNGKLLRSGKVQAESFQVDVSSLPEGLYLVRLSAQGKTANRKLLIQR